MTHLLAAAILAAVPAAGSAHDVWQPAISDLNIDIAAGQALTLTMNIDPRSFDIPRDNALTIVPVIASGDSSIYLPPVVVAGATRYIRYVREPERRPSGAALLHAGKYKTYSYAATIAYRPWMEQSTVCLLADESGCCGRRGREISADVAVIDLRPNEFVVPAYVAEAPAVSDSKTIEIHGSANVDFRVNRTEIDPGYRNNPAELAKILSTINVVRDNPDATINSITIKGYASPESPYSNNRRLAKGRTESLVAYVGSQYDFAPSVFHSDYEPEDWQGLRDSVVHSIVPNRDAILAIIDGDLEPDAKEAAIKRGYPADYKYLLDNVYPALRHSDYTVRYTIREYTDIDEIRRVMRERPSNLSLREFHLLASSYPAGSDTYNEVFDVAVRMYPDDPTSNLNAAAVALNKGDCAAAERYLSRAGDTSDSRYLTGIMLALKGDTDGAREQLSEARRLGAAKAAEALANLERHVAGRTPVSYLPIDSTTSDLIKKN